MSSAENEITPELSSTTVGHVQQRAGAGVLMYFQASSVEMQLLE